MQISQRFELRRLWLLIRNDVLTQYRGGLVSIGTWVGVLLLLFIFSSVSGRQGGGGAYHLIYTLILYVGGFLYTSASFNDLHDKRKSTPYLLLPASTLEKFICKLILSSIGYAIGSLVFFYLYTVLASGLSRVVFDRPLLLFDPLNAAIWKNIASYLVIQSVFLLGAVYFTSRAFIKTVFSMAGFFLLMVVLVLLCTWLIVHDSHFGQIILRNEDIERFMESGHVAAVAARTFFWTLLAPLFWIAGYLRFKKYQG